MPELNLQFDQYDFRIRNHKGQRQIYDKARRKYVHLSPEEWVRQHILWYLVGKLGYPLNRIAIEKKILLNGLTKRTDILVFDKAFHPILIVECKADNVKLNETVFKQIAAYNLTLKVPYLIVSNGPGTYACRINHDKESFDFLKQIPSYDQLHQPG